MHIHQPINVSSARLDEQWGNNHLICIACSHDSPFKDKIRERKSTGEKLEKRRQQIENKGEAQRGDAPR